MAFEHVEKFLTNNDENACDQQWMGYKAVLGFQIWLTEMFSNSMCLRLMEIYERSAAMMTSAVFNTRQHVASTGTFENSSNHICRSE